VVTLAEATLTLMKSIKGAVLLVALGLVILYVRLVWFTMFQLPEPCLPSSTGLDGVLAGKNDKGALNVQAMYESSLSTLRCLATPNCFPSSQCRTGIPKKIQRRKKWEEHSLCTDDVLQKKDCLVYSFGIHTSWEWEEKMARLLHCEVHAFDPTMNHPTNLAPGVTFHKLGLQAEGSNVSDTHAAEYDAIDPKLLLTLGQIMKQMGHVGRTLDVLALDCEGCEWGALSAMACSGESALVDQLFVEFHFQKNLGLATPDDVVRAAQGIDCLWHDRWHVVSIETSGSYYRDWEYARDVPQVIYDGGFLLYVSLQRIPPNQLRPSDYVEKAAHASRKYFEAEEDYMKEYKTDDKEKWPQEARDVLQKLRQQESPIYAAKERVSRQSKVQFDVYERLVEK
jgi:Methyltransferase domain